MVRATLELPPATDAELEMIDILTRGGRHLLSSSDCARQKFRLLSRIVTSHCRISAHCAFCHSRVSERAAIPGGDATESHVRDASTTLLL